ncbi:MAG: Glycyl-tRNA synthetase [Candidatus Alkanophagales archaeon MCA70_species_1]|nr:Glycyl-tRNA synthetase [Candidatus Alkanophaga volatiphilum]
MTAARREDEVMELARRRGFIWAAFEIYGGASGFFDYGPLGAALKRKIESLWREFYTLGEGFYEIETTTIGIRDVFDASGHLECFMDKMVECKKCHSLFRADHVGERCPDCGGEFSEPQDFNLMFKTRIGAVTSVGGKSEAYLRPETAQGMFVNFPRLLRFHRNKLPFGIIQIGRAYRNEISPRQGIIRLREFTLAEAEVFVLPHEKNKHPRFHEVEDVVMRLKPNYMDEEIEITVKEAVERKIIAHEYLGYHMARVQQFLEKIGIPVERLRFRQHEHDEMAHYAEDCWDAEFLSDRFGWVEIVGIADRGDYDLSAHSRKAKVDMSVPVVTGGEEAEGAREGNENLSVFPHVIEPSYGIDRIIYALLESSFYKEEVRGEVRRVLRFKRCVAPVEVAVLPLLNRKELVNKAKEVFQMIRSHGIFAEYDASGSIGRRYRRQDEIGTPYCVTIDYETLENDTVTIRDRDSMKQVRVSIAELPAKLRGDVESMFTFSR